MEERWSNEHECEKEDGIAHLQSQIQRLEKENTDFLAALEDAMEQYKQQVRHGVIIMWLFHESSLFLYRFFNLLQMICY